MFFARWGKVTSPVQTIKVMVFSEGVGFGWLILTEIVVDYMVIKTKRHQKGKVQLMTKNHIYNKLNYDFMVKIVAGPLTIRAVNLAKKPAYSI